jgi:hypothetical protein
MRNKHLLWTQNNIITTLLLPLGHIPFTLIQTASTLYPPTSVANIFGNWLHSIDFRFKVLIRVGALAVIWSLWLCRNNKVFNDKNCSLLQVIYKCTSTLRLWSPLQRMENRDLLMEVCTRLEVTPRDIFSPHGCITFGSDHHRPLRQFTIARYRYVFCLFSLSLDLWTGWLCASWLCRGRVYCLSE